MIYKITITGNPRKNGDNVFYKMFMNESAPVSSEVWIGIDWCAGHGFIRGEIIKREDNIVHVRFSDVTI